MFSIQKSFYGDTKTSIEDEGVYPFTECITIASACHLVFRRNFMPERSIGLIAPLGYCAESTSYKGILWLKYIATTQNVNIQHARNGGEKRIELFKE